MKSLEAKALAVIRALGGSAWFVPPAALGYGKPNLLSSPEFANGVTDAPTRDGLVTASTLAGYDGAIAFGHNGTTLSYAYKSFTPTIGLTYTLSVIIRMDDGLPPSFIAGYPEVTANPFGLVANNNGIQAQNYTVAAQADGTYRISAPWTVTAAGNNFGVVKYAVNNNRTFKVTGYKLEQSATATEYTPQSVLRQHGVYSDSTGTTPVTAVGDLVGLITDKSYGGQLGVELVPATYSGSVTGSWVISPTSITRNGTTSTACSLALASATVSTKLYRVEFTVSNLSGDMFTVNLGGANVGQISTNGRKSFAIAGGGSGMGFVPWGGTAGQLTVTNVTVREVLGSHATQATTANKPVIALVPKRLGAELLIDSSFDDATKWTAGAGWAVTGGNAVATSTASGANIQPSGTGYGATAIGTNYKAEVVISSLTGGSVQLIIWNGSTNVASSALITAPGTYSVTYTASNTQCRPYLAAQAAGTSLVAASLSQKEVLEWSNALSFDGSNDFLQTGITTGNQGWMCAGVNLATSETAYLMYAGANSNTEAGVVLRALSGRIQLLCGNGTVRDVNDAAAITVGSAKVYAGGWNASTMIVSVDDVEIPTPKTVNCTGSIAMALGSRLSGFPAQGPVSAFIYTPVLPSESQRQLIRRWVGSLQGQTL